MKTRYINEKKLTIKRNRLNTVISFILFLFTLTGKAQTIYFENFDELADYTTTDNGKTAWTRDVSGTYLADGGELFVIYGLFGGFDLDGEGVWRSEVMNISSFPDGVDISMDAYEMGDFESNDYIRFYYRVNGGSEVLIRNLTDDFNFTGNMFTPTPVSVSGVTGNMVQIVVRMRNNDGVNEGHGFDNVYVHSTATNISLYTRANGNWDEENNWSVSGFGNAACNCYPDGTTDVYIGNNNTISTNVNGVVENIFINNGNMTNNLNRTLNVVSTLDFVTSGSSFTNNGTLVIGNDLKFSNDNHTFTNNGTLTIADDITSGNGDDNNLITNSTGATLNLGDAITLTNGNMTINNSGTINQSGTFTNGSIDTGSSFNNLNGGTWNWSYAGTAYDNSMNTVLNCSGATNTFNYNANGNQNILPVRYVNLILSASGTKTSQNNMDVNGNLTLAGAATLNVASGSDNITLGGNWINAGGSFTEGSQTVTLDGSGDQIISNAGGETFNHLTINKTAGLVTLANGNVQVNGNLTLTAGSIALGEYNLTLGNTASVVSGSAASYVVTNSGGQLIQNALGAGARTGDVLFPVGVSASSYTPLWINNSTGTADNFGVKICSGVYFDGSCGSGTAASEDVVDRSWFITEAVIGGSNAALTFQWNASNELPNFDRTGLTLVHHNGTKWEEKAFTAASGSGPYTAMATGISSFSPFGLETSNSGTLPIELTSFSANLNQGQVQLQWITASELNNDFFTIEKTSDFKTYEQVATVQGKGTYNGASTYVTTDNKPYAGIAYYRLKQTDFDGNFTYSEFVAVSNHSSYRLATKEVKLYPVPNNGARITLSLTGMEAQNLSLTIFDLAGFVVYAEQITVLENEEIAIDFNEKLNPGIYTLRLGNNSQPVFRKFVVR